MAADYRDPVLAQLCGPLRQGEAEFARATTRLFVSPDQGAEVETTVMVSLSLDRPCLTGTGGWRDDLTQTCVQIGRRELHPDGDLGAWLSLLTPAQLILLHVHGQLTLPAEQVRQFTIWLRAVTVAPVVVVGGDVELRLQLNGVAGFVVYAGTAPLYRAIGLLASLHSAVSAPHRMNCVDIEWVLSVLGSAIEPAVFVQGVWRRHPVELLAMATEGDGSDFLNRADRVLLVPGADQLRPAEVMELAKVFRTLAKRPDLDIVCAMPVDRASSDGLSPEFGTLSALVRPAPGCLNH